MELGLTPLCLCSSSENRLSLENSPSLTNLSFSSNWCSRNTLVAMASVVEGIDWRRLINLAFLGSFGSRCASSGDSGIRVKSSMHMDIFYMYMYVRTCMYVPCKIFISTIFYLYVLCKLRTCTYMRTYVHVKMSACEKYCGVF